MRRVFGFPSKRSGLAITAVSLALAAWFVSPAGVLAQGGKSKKGSADTKKGSADTSKRAGTIAEVEKKGKAATLTVQEADGEKFPVQVAPKTKFEVHGKGDAAFFKHPHVSVSSERVVLNPANNYLFGRTFTVYLGSQPEPLFEKDEVSAEVCHIAGPVVDADDESFTISVAGTPYKIAFEKGVVPEISVISTDPAHAAVGSEIEVEGTARGGKFHPSSIVVTLEKPMVADEVFAAEKGDKKGAKSKAQPASKGKTAKKAAKSDQGDADGGAASGDDSDGTPIKPASDPFNVSGKDKKGKTGKKGGGKPIPKTKNPFDDDSGT
jgi:hypothetical protein